MEPTIPVPLEHEPSSESSEKRLWIGNVDTRITEYQLVQVLKKFGRVEKFDFLFHKSGPVKGQPRGYCFVTFEKREQAQEALSALNGKKVLSKCLIAKWAHSVKLENAKEKTTTVALQNDAPSIGTGGAHHQIQAIEAKLKMMENQQEKELQHCFGRPRFHPYNKQK